MGLRSCSRSSCFIDDWLEIVRPKRSRAERGLRCTLTSAITSNNMASKAMSFHSNARGRGNGQWQYQDHWAQPKDYLSVDSFFDMPRRQSRWPCQRQCEIDSGNGWNDPKEGMDNMYKKIRRARLSVCFLRHRIPSGSPATSLLKQS